MSSARLLLASSLLVVAAPAAFARTTVPVRGAVVGSVTVIPLGPGDTYRLENRGTGTMSQLGRIETEWAIPAVELDLLRRELVVANVEWSGTITAASGDRIFGRYTFPSDRIPFSLAGDVTFVAELEVTGGTGRFANATGRATAVGEANIYRASFQIRFEGEMSRVGPEP